MGGVEIASIELASIKSSFFVFKDIGRVAVSKLKFDRFPIHVCLYSLDAFHRTGNTDYAIYLSIFHGIDSICKLFENC